MTVNEIIDYITMTAGNHIIFEDNAEERILFEILPYSKNGDFPFDLIFANVKKIYVEDNKLFVTLSDF